MKHRKLHAIFALALLTALPAGAAITYATSGFLYSENFNTLDNDATGSPNPAWTNDVTVPGWSWQRVGQAAPTTYAPRTGSVGVQGRVLSLGTDDDPDRALGSQSNDGPGTVHYGANFINSTTQTLTSFTLGYTGETWRYFPVDATDGLVFEYQIFTTGTGSLTAASGWTAVTALNYTSIVDNGTGTTGIQLNGNLPENRSVLSETISGLSWEDGQSLWIRWSDISPSGNIRSMMGVDDVTFVAIPEPSAVLLGALGTLALIRRRR